LDRAKSKQLKDRIRLHSYISEKQLEKHFILSESIRDPERSETVCTTTLTRLIHYSIDGGEVLYAPGHVTPSFRPKLDIKQPLKLNNRLTAFTLV